MTFKENKPSTKEPAGHPNLNHLSHLTTEQMEAMLRQSPFRLQAMKHLDVCASCREEVEALSKLLSRFRSSSMVYAEQMQTRSQLIRSPHSERFLRSARSLRWCLAAVALACIFATPAVLRRLKPILQMAPAPAGKSVATRTSDISDEALLEDVQNDLAASVPAPLQMLTATQPGSVSAADHGKTRHSMIAH
jgi:hypothetical protein